MELILGTIIIIIVLLILGIGIDVIILGIVGLMLLLTALTELFFLYCVVRLMLSKRREAVFTRIARREKGRYDTAFYMTDGEELPNIFPCEVIMRNKLYDPERQVKVRLDAGRKFVYDRNAVLTILFGTVLCALLCFFLIAGGLILFGLIP